VNNKINAVSIQPALAQDFQPLESRHQNFANPNLNPNLQNTLQKTFLKVND